jgi:hypothetical protein
MPRLPPVITAVLPLCRPGSTRWIAIGMPALPVESLDALGDPEVDRIHAPHAVGQRRRPVRGEGEVVALVVVVAHELVGQDGPVALALAAHLFVLVAPDADQCLDGGALDVVEAGCRGRRWDWSRR